MSALTAPEPREASLATGARRRPSRQAIRALALGAVALALPLAYGSDSYTMSIATEALIYALITVTLNLLIGYGGQISIGHAGLLAVGGYLGAELGVHIGGLPWPVEVLAAGVGTAIVGFLLGLPTGRLRGHYLAITTLGFGLIVPQVALNWTSFTGGREGLIVNPARIAGLTLSSPASLYYATLVAVALALIGIVSILASSTGRAFMAVRDSEAAAAAMGVDVRRTKVLLFTTSAFFAGIAGDLDVHLQGIVSPDSFPFSLSLFFLAAVVVGGMGSVWGSIAGGVLFTVLDAKIGGSGAEPILIGATVVVLLLVSPRGLAELPRALRGARLRLGRALTRREARGA